MALSQSFQVGNRVRTIRKHGDLPKGTNGTITRIFEAADCSDVQFDRHPGHRLIAHSDLAMIAGSRGGTGIGEQHTRAALVVGAALFCVGEVLTPLVLLS